MSKATLNKKAIQHWLVEHDCTQTQLAEKAGIDASSLSAGMTGGAVGMRIVMALKATTGLPLDTIVIDLPEQPTKEAASA